MTLERKNFPGLDLLKFICSIIIIFLHINPFPEPIRFITKAIGNLGVPCFFIISGFLFFRKLFVAPKEEQSKILIKQLKRLAILLAFWQAMFFIVSDFWWIKEGNVWLNILEYGRRILFGGGGFFLWYVGASIVGLALSFMLWRGLKEWVLIPACLLFIIAAIPSAYNPWISGSFYDDVYKWYCTYFATARNGLFFAFPCMSFGMLLAKKETDILRFGKKTCFLLIPAVGFFIGECLLAWYIFHTLYGILQISAVVLSFVLVMAFMQIKKDFKASVWMRKMSFLIYVIHALWLEIIPRILSLLSSWDIDYYWYLYWGVQIPILLILTISTGWLLILLSRKIPFLKRLM